MKIEIEIPDAIAGEVAAATAALVKGRLAGPGVNPQAAKQIEEAFKDKSDVQIISEYFRGQLLSTFENEVKKKAVEEIRKLY